MPTKYKLTYKQEQGGRWRKRYKGKQYYFNRVAGESKAESYRRCLQLWKEKKAEIDAGPMDWEIALKILIDRATHDLFELQDEGKYENREKWLMRRQQLAEYEYELACRKRGEHPMPNDLGTGPREFPDPHNPKDWKPAIDWGIGTQLYNPDDENPPWYYEIPIEAPEGTLRQGIDLFLKSKSSQVDRGERSASRYDSIRIGVELFATQAGEHRPITLINTAVLNRFKDHLESLIEKGELSGYSGRDRLQAVKQFVRWAYEQELIETLPRVIQSREFAIAVGSSSIETFTDDEIKRLLSSASDTTRLYLLLMLNCGMQQADIAELRHDEVDWKRGYIHRKRSKTRKGNRSENVPTVRYLLWAETISLLKEHRSSDKHLVLTNQKGQPLKVETIENGKLKKVDNIRSAYRRLAIKVKVDKPSKLLRKTAATKLGSHPEYSRFAQHFLGHAPSTIADRHYVVPPQEQFDEAVSWLRNECAI